jgi:hypothetical protein
MAGGSRCYFWNFETVDHLLFVCPTAEVVWGIIAICFQHRHTRFL